MTIQEAIKNGTLFIIKTRTDRYGGMYPGAKSLDIALKYYRKDHKPDAGTNYEVTKVIGGSIGGFVAEVIAGGQF